MDFCAQKYGIDLNDAVICTETNGRVLNFLKKARDGEKLNLVAFGGSITQGSLASAVEKSYSYLLYEWLKNKYGKTKLSYYNSGVGGTGSLYGAIRLKRDVAEYEPDLVLVDFSVNDDVDALTGETFEGVIRQIIKLEKSPAIVVLGNVFYDSGKSAQVIHSAVCRHYGIPMISMDTTLYKAVLTGGIRRRDFTPDDLHPNDFGHQLLAEALINYFDSLDETDNNSFSADQKIPPFLFSDTYEYMNPFTVTIDGFSKDNSERHSVQDRFVEGYTASAKGNSIVFEGYGTSISVVYRQVVSETDMSPDAEVTVDGIKLPITLKGWFEENWGENLKTEVIADHLPYGKHRIEIELSTVHDNDTKPFYLCDVFFTGKKPELMMMDPVCTHNVWGGTRIRDDFGFQVEGDDIGECWGVSAHPNGDGTVRNGSLKGMKLSEVYKAHPGLFYLKHSSGKNSDESCPFYADGTEVNESSAVFPLLIKIIDAKTDLSIQVHPDDDYARKNENGSLGKKECWYVLDAPENGALVVGHNAKTKEELKEMVADGRWKELIREIPVKKGDFIQIDPGTVHAIKGGLLILETQQNSDITYRVYDYDRLYHGKKRQLHVKQSLDVIKVPAAPLDKCVIRHDRLDSDMKPDRLQSIYKCDKYEVMRLEVKDKDSFEVTDTFYTVSVIGGNGMIDGTPIRKGDFFIIPAGYGEAIVKGDAELILSKP